MVKKLILLALIVLAGYWFYNKFLADTMEPFFKKHMNNVDFFGTEVRDYKVK